jgi:hypothetical protein
MERNTHTQNIRQQKNKKEIEDTLNLRKRTRIVEIREKFFGLGKVIKTPHQKDQKEIINNK